MGPQPLSQHIASYLKDLYGLHLLDGPVLVTCSPSHDTSSHKIKHSQNNAFLKQKQKNPKPIMQNQQLWAQVHCTKKILLPLLWFWTTAFPGNSWCGAGLCHHIPLLLWLRCWRKCNNSSAVAMCGLGYSLSHIHQWFHSDTPGSNLRQLRHGHNFASAAWRLQWGERPRGKWIRNH